MKNFKAQFTNIKDELIKVYISVGDNVFKLMAANEGAEELTLGDSPVIINQNSDGLLSPIKSLSCTIKIVTDHIIEELYTTSITDAAVIVYNETTKEFLFVGYITPNAYNQSYTWIDEMEIECISRVSALEYFDYFIKESYRESLTTRTIGAIIRNCFEPIKGFDLNYTYNENLVILQDGTYKSIFESLYLNERNFIEDEGELKSWTCKEVLEEICKTFGLTLVEHNNMLHFLDYYYLNNGGENTKRVSLLTGTKYNIEGLNIETPIGLKNRWGNAQVSYDETYNKISVSDNFYFPKETVIEMDKEADLIPLSESDKEIEYDPPREVGGLRNLDYLGNYYGYHNVRDNHEGRNNLSWVKFYKSNKWKSLYYPKSNKNYDYYDLTVYEAPYIEEYTAPLVLCAKEAHKTMNDNWDDQIKSFSPSIYFIIAPHKAASSKVIPNDELYLSYKEDLNIPNDISRKYYLWIDFSAIYQDRVYYPIVLNGVAQKIYSPLRLTEYTESENAQRNNNVIWLKIRCGKWYLNSEFDYTLVAANPHLEAKWLIDDKYIYKWKKDYWTKDPDSKVAIFYEDKGKHYLGIESKLLSNIDWKMGIQKSNGYAFPIPEFIDLKDIEISFYEPVTLDSSYRCEAVWIKDFKAELIERNLDRVINKDIKKDDVLYTTNINESSKNEFSDIELKINTNHDNKYSYSNILVADSDYTSIEATSIDRPFKYLKTVFDKDKRISAKVEEFVVNKYYSHYKSPKLVLNIPLEYNSVFTPYTIFREKSLDKSFFVDNYEYDVRYNKVDCGLIETSDYIHLTDTKKYNRPKQS